MNEASGIFISYRRTDNPDATGRIYDRLVSEFGKARVFKDVDSIPLGQDFRSHLNDVVGGCAAVLAIIGPKWIDIQDSRGRRRLEDPDDFVRIELEAALARDIPVVPVLVGHASMPAAHELPASLTSLAYRQSIELRPDPDFHNDATRLVLALKKILDPAWSESAARSPDAPTGTPASIAGSPASSRAKLFWPITAAGSLLIASVMTIPALKLLGLSAPAEVRTEIVTGDTPRQLDFELSPDGRQITYVGSTERANVLWLRSLDSSTARPLPGTEGAMKPFWSPDGRSIAFYTPTALKRLDLQGGQSRVISSVSSVNPGGGTWNAEGVIVYSPSVTAPLYRVNATGGTPTPETKLESLGHTRPLFLPGGERFLFQSGGSRGTGGIWLATLDGKKPPVRVLSEGALGGFLPSGWIIYALNGSIVAQRLDVDAGQLTGDPLVVAEADNYRDAFNGGISVSATGLIAYRTMSEELRELRWFSRSGQLLGRVGEPDATYGNPRISPDGRRVAVDRTKDGNMDVYILDDARAVRLTFDPDLDGRSLWHPNGQDIIFYSARSGTVDLYRKSSEGGNEESKLIQETSNTDRIRVPTSISPDGRYLLFLSARGDAPTAIAITRLDGDRKPMSWLRNASSNFWGVFSPDGRWVAYSDETEVYVSPFFPPDGEGGVRTNLPRWQISDAGGSYAVWSHDGRELYFLSKSGDIMAASITVNKTSVSAGAPVKLFSARILGSGIESAIGRQYDVARDGRFLVNTRVESGRIQPITLIQNWDPERAAR